MRNIEIKPATFELLSKFYGKNPPRTSRSFVAVEDGEVIGVAGIYVADEKMVLFSEFTEKLRKDKRAIARGIKEVMKMVKESKIPVYALADPKTDGADKLLNHLGFVKEYEGVYAWHS